MPQFDIPVRPRIEFRGLERRRAAPKSRDNDTMLRLRGPKAVQPVLGKVDGLGANGNPWIPN